MKIMNELKRSALSGLVIALILISYVVVAHLGYAHGYDAGYHEIVTESNQE